MQSLPATSRRGCQVSEPVHSFQIHLFRIENTLGDHSQPIPVHLAKEAAFVPLVASSAANLIHLEQHGVGVAAKVDAADFLNVSTLLALTPELASAAAVVHGAAGADGFLVRLPV